jgi:hypothetical protein
MRMNIDLAEAGTAPNLNDSCACVEKPLLAFAVALLDDSAEVIDRVRWILNRQRTRALFRRQAFLERELGVFLLRPWAC